MNLQIPTLLCLKQKEVLLLCLWDFIAAERKLDSAIILARHSQGNLRGHQKRVGPLVVASQRASWLFGQTVTSFRISSLTLTFSCPVTKLETCFSLDKDPSGLKVPTSHHRVVLNVQTWKWHGLGWICWMGWINPFSDPFSHLKLYLSWEVLLYNSRYFEI